MRPEEKKKRWKKAEEILKSRKEQKKIEKIKFKRKSKLDRHKLLAELKKCQLTSDQIDQMHSTSSMQTKGLKRFTTDDKNNSTTKRIKHVERAEKCLDAATLLAKKRPKCARKSHNSSSSSSEDTDAISSDSEQENEMDQIVSASSTLSSQTDAMESPCTDLSPIDIAKKQANENIEPQIEDAPDSNIKSKIDIKSQPKREPAIYVEVHRSPEIQKARLELPIINEEQHIIETIRYNDVVILSGETGSGKTTQIPQFLYEAGYTSNDRLIGITEPRRVAAISMSERVAKELSLTSDEVSYQIRFSGNVTPKTIIKFLTDGVLLRECQHDFLLSRYSVIIIDEAHERSVFSDILIGLLSRIVPMRKKMGNPLKFIIMSATLRIDDFAKNQHLFKTPPPVINIDARQYIVTHHFAKQTPTDYMGAAFKKVKAINKKMPKGGILVFVTSQDEVKTLCAKLKRSDPETIHCVALYAMLPIHKQRLVFNEPPKGKRLCVVATNVAETSITIPNIKYVVDTGKEKKKEYDLVTGAYRFVVTWTSKSSADQRMGRAGRMGPGHCYRLYHSAVFQSDFLDYAEPPILGRPVEDIVLQMKSMNIDNVVNFPFPNRPNLEALQSAERKLINLGALDDSKVKSARYAELEKVKYSSRLTPLGKAMSTFAVSARSSKMLVLSPENLVNHVIALVSALTVREMFQSKKKLSKGCTRSLGDYDVMLRAVCTCECNFDKPDCPKQYCTKLGLRHKAMSEIAKLRRQLFQEVKTSSGSNEINEQDKLRKPSDSQSTVIRQLLLSSYCDHVARKVSDGYREEKCSDDPSKTIKKKIRLAYESMETNDLVYIDAQSVLKDEHPEYIIYKELSKGEKKTYMRDICIIEPEWLPHYAHKLCNFSDKPTSDKPRYDRNLDQIICTRNCTYGPMNWSLGTIEAPMHLIDSGIEIYKYFAYHLLSGDVVDWFKQHIPKMHSYSQPSIMLKPWSSTLQPKTSKFLHAIAANNIKSKKDLRKLWHEDKCFLKKEYLMLFPVGYHATIEKEWESVAVEE